MQEVCRSSRLVTALLLRFAGDQWGSIALFLPDYKHLSVVDKSCICSVRLHYHIHNCFVEARTHQAAEGGERACNFL